MILMITIWGKDDKNQKDKRKEIIITNIIENDKINITVKNDTKLLRTI